MKLLIVNGTPKTDGVCYSFVRTAREAAAEFGIDAEVVRLSGETLDKCRMCGGGWGICFKEHYCVFGEEDGFSKLQQKAKEADAFVYVTPVYWGEVSEEMKIFLDKLRRSEASKQWDGREEEVSFHKGKPTIMVAAAGGGGGGILSALRVLERAVGHMGGDSWPRERTGIFDYIAVNRWNQVYKRDALKAAIKEMAAIWRGDKTAPDMN